MTYPEELRPIAADFGRWLEENERELDAFRDPPLDVAARLASSAGLLGLLARDGWLGYGWPEEFGGRGGDTRIRGIVYDLLEARGVAVPEQMYAFETVGPAVAHFAPHLARAYFAACVRGEETWAQYFSEPEAGSDLAALRCRAVPRPDGSFRVSGTKIWSSYGDLAARAVLLARTGTLESRHRGLTMFLVDTDSPGITRRPIMLANGESELSEIFFDDVAVPAERCIGAVDSGWAVAMYLLQFERGMYAWLRMAHLRTRLRKLAASVDPRDRVACRVLGRAYLDHRALRARTWRTLGRLARGENPGPEISVDKVLLATAEQSVLDAARQVQLPDFVFGDDEAARRLRSDWFYTRAASIYGGALEIQRTIVADRLMHLPQETKA